MPQRVQGFPVSLLPSRLVFSRCAVGEALDLRAHGAASAQREGLDVVLGAGEAADLLGDLFRQLPRGAEHERLHIEATGIELRKLT